MPRSVPIAIAIVLLLEASLLGGCREVPKPYLHTLYVEALDAPGSGEARLRVRLVQADGRPAPAPEPRSVFPVARGRRLSSELIWSAVAPGDVSVAFLSDPGLNEASRKVEADLHAAIEGTAAWSVTVAPNKQSAAAPRRLPGGARARSPTRSLQAAFEKLEARPEGGRRVVLVSVRGNAIGRVWNRQAARALAAGADLIVLAFAPPGRSAPRPRAVHPLFVFPVDPTADMTPVKAALREAVGGGMWASFDTDLPAVELASGLALRARLPRGGWEEFALAPVESPTVRVVIDSIRQESPGRCGVAVRVLDAIDRPLPPTPGDISFEAAGVPLSVGPVPAHGRNLLLVIDTYLRDGAALRTLVDAALSGLSATDQAVIVQAGSSNGAPTVFGPADEVRATAAALGPAPPAAQSDIFTQLEELERRLGETVSRLSGPSTLVVLSGLHPVRAVESVGAPAPRLRAVLRKWRKRGAVPVWAVLSAASELRRFPAVLARLGAVGIAARKPDVLAERLRQALAGRRSGRVALVACPDGPDALSSALRVKAAWRGRSAVGRPL